MKSKALEWAERNRVVIAIASVVGSFAGLVFSLLDLQTSMQANALKKQLAEKDESDG